MMSQCLQTTHGCGHAGPCYCSNTTHRLGKYYVPSTDEVPGNVGRPPLLPWATSYQTAKPDTGSGLLPAFLTGCREVRICIVTWRGSALFLDRHPDNQPLIACKTRYRCVLHKHTYSNAGTNAHRHTERWFTILTPIKLCPSGGNESVAFFLSSEQREKNDCRSSLVHKRQTCSKCTWCVSRVKRPILPQLRSLVSDSSDSSSLLSL